MLRVLNTRLLFCYFLSLSLLELLLECRAFVLQSLELFPDEIVFSFHLMNFCVGSLLLVQKPLFEVIRLFLDLGLKLFVLLVEAS